MELEFAMLAEGANSLPDGRFNILGGGIESLYAQTFPVTHPYMVIVLRITGRQTEMKNPHEILIYLKDADGKDLVNAIKIPLPPAPAEMPASIKKFNANLIGQLANIHFPQKGTCSLEILLDGRYEKSLPLELIELPKR